MTDEQKEQQEVTQSAAEETTETTPESVEPDATSEPQTESTPQETEPKEEVEAVDEQGVPYKNRAAMYKRQLEETQRKLEYGQAPQPVQPQPVQANKPDPKQALDEFVNIGPDAWYEQRRAREILQEQTRTADQMILDKANKDPQLYRVYVQKVFDTAKEWNIDLQANPLAGVNAVMKLWDRDQSATKQVSPEKKEAEKKRVEKINKTKTEGGSKPPAPPANKSSESLQRLKARGSDEDVVDYLKDIL